MKNAASNNIHSMDPLAITSRREFYAQCESMCAKTNFKSTLERLIMEMYCEGMPQQEIRRKLQTMGFSRHRSAIANTIRKYLILFGLHGK